MGVFKKNHVASLVLAITVHWTFWEFGLPHKVVSFHSNSADFSPQTIELNQQKCLYTI